MTTKRKVLFVFTIIAALFIGFVVGINVNYPMPDKSLLGGTVGKAKKYHKTSMTARDIQLRSELLKDTAKLKTIIREMAYFSLLTEEVGKSIDLSMLAFHARGMGSTAGEENLEKILSGYSDFITNNNKTLNSTISLLIGFCTGDTTDLSLDVEKNLRDFGAYVTNLSEKNLVLNQAILALDNFMLNHENLKTQKSDFAQLKSVRDQLALNALELVGLVCGKEQVGELINNVLASEDKLGFIMGNEKLQLIEGQQHLNLDGIMQGSLYTAPELDFIMSTCNSALVYDMGSKQISLLDKAGLQVVLASERLQVLAVLSNEKLNVVMSNCSLQLFSQSDLCNLELGRLDFNRILALNNAENIFGRSIGLIAATGFLANQNLGYSFQ